MYAVIRIRGTVNIAPKIETALEVMNLRRANNLSLWAETPQTLKMIKVVKDYTTFGKVNEETLKVLIEAKARPIKSEEKLDTKKVLADLKAGKTLKQAGVKNCFTMSPPRKGFERKGIKVAYTVGGALGDRKEKINEIIMRMI